MLDGETPNSVIKLRVYPTKPPKSLLNRMLGTHRAIHNQLVESSREDCYALKKSELVAKHRPISRKRTLETYLPDHHLEVPEYVMDSTFRDFTKALESSKALYQPLKEKARTVLGYLMVSSGYIKAKSSSRCCMHSYES